MLTLRCRRLACAWRRLERAEPSAAPPAIIDFSPSRRVRDGRLSLSPHSEKTRHRARFRGRRCAFSGPARATGSKIFVSWSGLVCRGLAVGGASQSERLSP
jgi:hypothetical protein